jgi:hypothetical protein
VGISLNLLQAIVKANGFSKLIDVWVSLAFSWNLNYHPCITLHRFRARSVFLVLKKVKIISTILQ